MLAALLAVSLLAAPPVERAWRINEHNTLLWNEQPYLPVGLRIDGTPTAVAQAKAAGAKDVIVDLPADGTGWAATIRALEEAGLRYLIAISTAAPTCTGISVEPQGYRVPGITEPRRVELRIPGATSGLVALVTQRDGAVQMTDRVTMPEGNLSLDVDPKNQLEHVLLVYPLVQELRVPDYWLEFDRRRDELIQAIRANKPGPGLRGILNPMGSLLSFPGPDAQFVPTNRVFRMELEAFLRAKYTSLQTAIRAWSLSINDIQSFAALARCVPLWTAARGIPQLWDPDTGELVGVSSRGSSAWKDIQEVLRSTSARRYARLADAIRTVANVPVLQEWVGWSGPYSNPEPALDGVGMRMVGASPSSLVDSGCRAASTILRWRQPGWLIASSVVVEGQNQPDALLADALADAASMGARGWFVRATSDTLRRAAVSADVANDTTLPSWRPSALFYPEAAMNPAAPTRLPGGRWWLPSPASGNRVDLGSNYAAYRYSDGSENFVALWSIGTPRKTVLRLADAKRVVFETIDASQTGARVVKNTIELTVPTTPILLRGSDEIPVPQEAIEETVHDIETILEKLGPRAGTGEEAYRLAEAIAAMERNPGGAFDAMRQQLTKLDIAHGNAVWVEGESTRDTNFSEPAAVTGVSKNAALTLRSRLASPPEGYYANYVPNARVEGMHELWVAANIPPKHRNGFTVRIGDQALRIQRGPVSLYASGYGWYKMGEISLIKGPIMIQVAVDSKEGAEVAIDVLLLAPDSFTPNGVFPPRAFPP